MALIAVFVCGVALTLVSATAVAGIENGTSRQTAGVDAVGTNATTNIVIRFANVTARENASFDSGVTVTGGADVQFLPVLFATTTDSMIPAIRSKPGIAAVWIDRRLHTRTPSVGSEQKLKTTATTTTGQAVPWGVQRIGVENVSDRIRKKGTRNVTVAVVDSGIDYTHPDLEGSVVWGANFTDGSKQYGLKTADDNSGHGTAVASAIAAKENNHGVVGVAPGVRLYAIKVLREDNTGTLSSLIRGIDAAISGPDRVIGTDDDADIIQMSVGTTIADAQLAHVVSTARNHTILVSSVGNSGDGNPETSELTFPAKYQETIAVAATNRDNETTSYSSEGPGVDISAPGHMIQALTLAGDTMTFSGTSIAAPYVSGTVALLLALDQEVTGGNRTNEELRALLLNSTQDIGLPGKDRFSGTGLVRADKVVGAIASGSGKRNVSNKTVAPGDNVIVTITAYAAGQHLTVSESFNPSFAKVEIRSVMVNGKSRAAMFQSTDRHASVVTLNGLNVGDKIQITYAIQLSEAGSLNETYRIMGEVTNSETERELKSVELITQSSSLTEIVSIYDRDDDHKIGTSELSDAAADYTNGELSITGLGAIAQAYASS